MVAIWCYLQHLRRLLISRWVSILTHTCLIRSPLSYPTVLFYSDTPKNIWISFMFLSIYILGLVIPWYLSLYTSFVFYITHIFLLPCTGLCHRTEAKTVPHSADYDAYPLVPCVLYHSLLSLPFPLPCTGQRTEAWTVPHSADYDVYMSPSLFFPISLL